MSRLSIYTPALADTICTRLAAKEFLRAICKDEETPSNTNVMRWLKNDEHVGFRWQYSRGREVGLEAIADELLEIADQPLPRLRDGRRMVG